MSGLFRKNDFLKVFFSKNTRDVKFLNIRLEIWICLALICSILAVYWQVKAFSYIHYDDHAYVFENPHVKTGISIQNVTWALYSTEVFNWHPVTWLSHMLDVEMFGMNPGKHHLTSVFIHIINTILLFLLLSRITGDTLPSGLVAGLFALHPLHIESVAWIAERKDLLCGLFFFISIYCYLWYLKTGSFLRYLTVLIFYSLGLMAKPMIVTFPFVLLLIDHWPLNRFPFSKVLISSPKSIIISPNEETTKKILIEKIPFLILAILSSIITIAAQKGAIATFSELPFWERITNALVSYFFYIYKFFLPINLSLIYVHPGSHPSWLIGISCLFFLIFSYVFISRSTRFPYLAVGWFWYLGMLFPVIGLIQVGIQAHADRYTYLPMIGIFIIFSWGLFNLFTTGYRYRFTIFSIFSCGILILISILSWKHLTYWNNGISLFSKSIAVTEKNYVAHNILGFELFKKKRYEEAKSHFNLVLQYAPNFESAHLNLGRTFAAEGNLEESIYQYQAALKINPEYIEAYSCLGDTLSLQGRHREAVEQYLQVLQILPKATTIYGKLGAALLSDGKSNLAIPVLQKALETEPHSKEIKNNLKKALGQNEQ